MVQRNLQNVPALVLLIHQIHLPLGFVLIDCPNFLLGYQRTLRKLPRWLVIHWNDDSFIPYCRVSGTYVLEIAKI